MAIPNDEPEIRKQAEVFAEVMEQANTPMSLLLMSAVHAAMAAHISGHGEVGVLAFRLVFDFAVKSTGYRGEAQ
jgi:hypothetical protein